MNLSVIKSSCIESGEIRTVDVEVSLNNGLPYYNVVGLADSAIKESRERVRNAIKNSSFFWPDKRITVNLSPAWFNKKGSSFDLAISLAILQASKQIPEELKIACWGELSLDGGIETVPEALALTDGIIQSEDEHLIIIPEEAKAQTESFITGINYASTLKDLVYVLINEKNLKYKHEKVKHDETIKTLDKSITLPIDLQKAAWRACQISVAGGHHLLMEGSAGSGKSSLARACKYLQENLNREEKYNLALKYSSLAYELKYFDLDYGIFREPHHSITQAALFGGSYKYPIGELALADGGILYLDEINQFPNPILDSLRKVLEEFTIERFINGKLIKQLCRFILIATCNPCKCGNLFERESTCICSDGDIRRYRSKLNTPFFDRISLFINLQNLNKEKLNLTMAKSDFNLSKYKEKVILAIERQRSRYEGLVEDGFNYNGRVDINELQKTLQLKADSKVTFKNISETLNLSIRSYQSILRVARTIADLENSNFVLEEHILEALTYRRQAY